YDKSFIIENEQGVRAVFYGLGSDGTVGANKNTIKIIGENTDNFSQAYFVYDSKKAGSMTISHLRFGPKPIRASYLISKSNFVGCHQFQFVNKYDVLETIEQDGVFLLNSPYAKEDVWDHLPTKMQEHIISKNLKFYVIDGYTVARDTGMGGMINTIMQTCFFAISGILPKEEAIKAIKNAIKKAYGKKGEEIIQMNFNAVDKTLDNLHVVEYPKKVSSKHGFDRAVSAKAPAFVQNVTAQMIAKCGDDLPVSALPIDGTYPTATAQWEKRNIAQEIPEWDPEICIQCGKCVSVCPHSVIRTKIYDPQILDNAPEAFKSIPAKDRDFNGMNLTIQVSPEDCTGCALCVDVCPVKNKTVTKLKAINMKPKADLIDDDIKNWDYFLNIEDIDRTKVKQNSIRGMQFLQPLFEFSGACAGCGETPYIKLMSQLFGDRAIIANATGCSSIYGGNLPTTPWTVNKEGRGPAWSNSLFEDNAEFGLGMRLALDKQIEFAKELTKKLSAKIGEGLVQEILEAEQNDEADIFEQRKRIELLKGKITNDSSLEAKQLLTLADNLSKKGVWIVGGDGWAYDIGFGGLDHVLASGRDINVLVLDTEVYSNTGGQMSKSTSRAAVAKFAAGGKSMPKKDLARIAMTYGNIYVANVSIGAKDEHTVKAFIEAEKYKGPSLIIAYSHCIAHGINMTTALQNQKAAVLSGYWPLFRYNPDLADEGKNPFSLDSTQPKIPLKEYAYRENRFKMLTKSKPEEAKRLMDLAQEDVYRRFMAYQEMAQKEQSEGGNGKAETGE
ncbi:MAG: pyruvate:ferredoxin (flavodoxin) oxidoreductase, partial [Candidatus Omnitrophica bacterium]|nr:pyruvate:ferredoxin (flavodoxin) oxidoreductase [Candidatus Omnitrophota bacterium]